LKAAVVPRPSLEDQGVARARERLERVILVDADDRPVGDGDKLDVHRCGALHRAFSILVFDDRNRLLLQQRAEGKYHFAGCWSNSCCGHPRPGEATDKAARRRLGEELGFHTPLIERTQLTYRAEDAASGLTEHEYLHVFWGRYVGIPRPCAGEVGAWRWMNVPAVHRALAERPTLFTPWFGLLMNRLAEQGWA